MAATPATGAKPPTPNSRSRLRGVLWLLLTLPCIVPRYTMQRETKRQARRPHRDESRACCTVITTGESPAPEFQLIDADEHDDDDAPQQPPALQADFLTLFAWPLKRQSFMDEYWQLKALLIKGGGAQRLDQSLVSEYLCDLDVDQLLEQSPSESIHVWLGGTATNKTGKVESIKVSEAEVALSCHRAGGSLYFRAPQPLADALISAAFMSLGASFSGWQPDGSMRGEVETFVSCAGHTTDWHWDFMENFTFQLKGTKRWLLKVCERARAQWAMFRCRLTVADRRPM